MKATRRFEGHVIVGAPHNYLDFEEELADRIGNWLRSAVADR
jgi:hypothetical protein